MTAGAARLAWSASSMRPQALLTVCADIAGRDRPHVVECGSGFATLTLARSVRDSGGRLLSLEHDPGWARRVHEELAAAGLAGTAQVVLAPLEAHPLARDGLPWYAQAAMGSLPARIDLLLVDGPPAFEPGSGLSRLPAVPVLADRLAPAATVVLDDIDRPGELAVLDAWEAAHGFRFERRADERIAVGRRAAPGR